MSDLESSDNSKIPMSSYDNLYSGKDFRRFYLADKGLISAILKKLELAEGSLLDVGSGRGYFSNLIAKLSTFRVTGIDLSRAGIDYAMANYGNRCHFLQGDFLAYPTSEKYDVVFCCQFSLMNVRELTSAQSVVLKLIKHLKPNGYLVLVWCTDFTDGLKEGEFNHKLRQFTDFERSFPFNSECFVTHPFIQVTLGSYCLNKLTNAPVRIISQLLRIPGYRVVMLGRI